MTIAKIPERRDAGSGEEGRGEGRGGEGGTVAGKISSASTDTITNFEEMWEGSRCPSNATTSVQLAMSKSPLQLLRARPSDRWKWVLLPSSILVLLSFLSAIRHDGPAALSLRSPVHETVAECRTDPDCIPSLKELVTRAAQRCAREASCVCDWNKDAKGCFMKEISRHSDLLQEAKALERLIEEREEIREQKQMLKRKLEGEQAKIASLIDRGKRNVKLHDFTDAERDARKAITVNKLVKRLNAAAKLHSGPSIRRQDVKINQFVGQLQAARRWIERGRERGGGSGGGERETGGESREEGADCGTGG
eukprot:766806-Hanusia_phi.AAC.8